MAALSLKCCEHFNTLVASHGLHRRTVETHALTHLEATEFANRLDDDAAGLCYCAVATFASAIQDIQRGASAWAAVKGYYASFYAMRSILASDGIGIAYLHSSPILVRAKPGIRFEKLAGATHIVAYSLFRKEYASDPFVTNDIDGLEPVEWLRANRERINYKTQRLPCELSDIGVSPTLTTNTMRRTLEEYLNISTYAFDPDHAAVALPMAFTLRVASKNNGKVVFQRSADFERTRRQLSDSAGPLANLHALLIDSY